MYRHIRAITFWQPWQVPILEGWKQVENRPWELKNLPKWIALHVGAKYDKEGAAFITKQRPSLELEPVPPGIYGVMRIVHVVDKAYVPDNPWAFGPYCWLISRTVRLPEPILCKGHQGQWTPPDEFFALFDRLERYEKLGHTLEEIRARHNDQESLEEDCHLDTMDGAWDALTPFEREFLQEGGGAETEKREKEECTE